MKINPEGIPLVDKSTSPQSICPLCRVNPSSCMHREVFYGGSFHMASIYQLICAFIKRSDFSKEILFKRLDRKNVETVKSLS